MLNNSIISIQDTVLHTSSQCDPKECGDSVSLSSTLWSDSGRGRGCETVENSNSNIALLPIAFKDEEFDYPPSEDEGDYELDAHDLKCFECEDSTQVESNERNDIAGRGQEMIAVNRGDGSSKTYFMYNDPTPAEQAAIDQFRSAWESFNQIKKLIPRLREKLHLEKRRLLVALRTLRNLNSVDYIKDIQERCGVKQSQAYNIDAAVRFAEEAGFLDKPMDWEKNNATNWECSPMPDISPMANAEQTHGDLRVDLIRLAKEGRFPSRNGIKKRQRGDVILHINLDCKTGPHRESDIDSKEINKVMRRMVLQTLRNLAKRGSQVARANLEVLEQEGAKQRSLGIQRPSYSPIPKKIVIKAEFEYAVTVPHWRKEYTEAQLEEDKKRAKYISARQKAQPKGWYLKQLRDSGDLQTFGRV